MRLIKVEDGLSEHDNFMLNSSIEDFLGNGEYTRTLNEFILKSGEIKRNFNFNDFVIEIKKDSVELSKEDEFLFFIETKRGQFGIKESQGEGLSKYWKLVLSDGFIQSYTSIDGLEWINIGGVPLENQYIKYQGFSQKGKNPLIIRDYKLYKSPYITINNFLPGTKVKLIAENNTLVKERIFDENMEAKIFLDYCFLGQFEFYDLEDNLILRSGPLNLKYGDRYLYTSHNLQLIHDGKVLFCETENLKTLQEILFLKNPSEDTYEHINLKVSHNTSDVIELSIDKQNYSDHLIIDTINPGEEIKIQLRILKDKQRIHFGVNDFSIDIF
ncbi:hypothetical protein [Anaerophilus nitritogenes]|uniref:hypothetical protein n=1 Tax=Anaerophilus nitritogenes TaxID=2498136 RepID=UPI00101D9E09|nr:hypothetical protein [Anaerophilus nitritogenes]